MIAAAIIGALLGAAAIGLASVGVPVGAALAAVITVAAGLGILLPTHNPRSKR